MQIEYLNLNLGQNNINDKSGYNCTIVFFHLKKNHSFKLNLFKNEVEMHQIQTNDLKIMIFLKFSQKRILLNHGKCSPQIRNASNQDKTAIKQME